MQLAIHLPSGRRQSSRERQSVDLWKTSGTPCEEVGSLPSVPARCRCRSQPALGLSAPAKLPKCSATAGELRAHAISSIAASDSSAGGNRSEEHKSELQSLM